MSLASLLGTLSARLLRQFDPETAHILAITAMKTGLVPSLPVAPDPRLAVRLFDLAFPHPIGLAAGFDKNAEVVSTLLRQGFSYVEVGSITPRAQPGNPRPRVFRLPEYQAVINRFGFNGKGHAHALACLKKRAGQPGLVGVNVGANKDSADRTADYVAGIGVFAGVADYFTANISSPNTPGLRDLQARAALDDLIARCVEARDATIATVGRRVPLLVKIAPDVSEEGLDDIAEVTLKRGLDGLVISNTTLSRNGIGGPHAAETGGLSGQPLFERSTIVLAKMRQRLGPDLPIIGVGGIATADQAYEKLAAGANLLQIYTSFIYAGGNAVADICSGLSQRLDREGLSSITAVTNSAVARWADRPIPG
ncbi:quinone-dependent dihydroorotate dehydrogenase [Oryzibacter oryziterrae]|uniref:quinone-dependent dihydroorotate dehydrogenase n=1 Tax=Oryzibacter oryziterrae TaxID=2766474 RepID=UPI001F023A18|nr:quinone-dependent dihydroorotate dehydrogenase [Oryzibacter oryziterrae]